MAKVRMYTQKGCPHCEGAKQYLEERKVSVEAIEIGFDPILQAGIRSLTNGQNFTVPITISQMTQELITGNDPTHLQRIVDSFYPPVASDPAA